MVSRCLPCRWRSRSFWFPPSPSSLPRPPPLSPAVRVRFAPVPLRWGRAFPPAAALGAVPVFSGFRSLPVARAPLLRARPPAVCRPRLVAPVRRRVALACARGPPACGRVVRAARACPPPPFRSSGGFVCASPAPPPALVPASGAVVSRRRPPVRLSPSCVRAGASSSRLRARPCCACPCRRACPRSFPRFRRVLPSRPCFRGRFGCVFVRAPPCACAGVRAASASFVAVGCRGGGFLRPVFLRGLLPAGGGFPLPIICLGLNWARA